MREVEIKMPPEDLDNEIILRELLAKAIKAPVSEIKDYRILRRSLDARYRPPLYLLKVEISTDKNLPPVSKELEGLKDVSKSKPVHIIGAGPAGYFAALECIMQGLRPIVIDRGKDVQSRRKDLKAIQQDGIVNPHSNYCFGEGGAGTYSDGKLYTRSGKRGNINSVLKILVECGAHPEILVDAHPHIGSNKLPGIIATLRNTIEKFGGTVLFNSWVNDFVVEVGSRKSNSSTFQGAGGANSISNKSTFQAVGGKITAIRINENEWMQVDSVILATGHSARDIFQLLATKKIAIEAKPFALGVRVEHAQSFVDECQYGMAPRNQYLPAASYALSTQMDNRGIFSFCMCPGGLIVPAATAPGEIVVNGMSLSRRDSPFANSGIVTSVELDDIKDFQSHEALMGMAFQRSVEQKMFAAGDGSQAAPAQRITDFIKKRDSEHLPETSYIPGIYPAPLHELFPTWIYERLKYGMIGFDHKMNGFIYPDAIVVATESRTSSPVRIPRNTETGMHIEVEGLFPCGEGAGYAGGIVSAAMDGQYSARAVARWFKENYV